MNKKELKFILQEGEGQFIEFKPYKYIGNSKIRCVRFKENERVNIIDKKEVDRGVIGNIEFAIQYLNECVPVRFEIIGSKRKEYPQFPEKLDEKIAKKLNERQRKAIEYINENGKITTKEYIRLVKTSIITAKRDLLDLKDKRLIKFVGPPKTGYYCFDDTVNDTVKRRKKT